MDYQGNNKQQLCKNEKTLFMYTMRRCSLESKRVSSVIDQAIVGRDC